MAVAHISFVGGGLFLPVHTERDREALVGYVADLIRTKGKVQILVDGRRWLADPNGAVWCTRCVHCEQVVDTPCSEAGAETDPHCLACALVAPCLDPAPRQAPVRARRTLAPAGA